MAQAKAKAKKDSGAMMLIVIVLLLTLVGAGTGFAVGALLLADPPVETSAALPEAVPTANEKEANHSTEAKNEVAKIPTEEEPADLVDPHAVKTIPFPPVLTTLAEPKGGWIRLEGSILVLADTEDSPELLADKAGEQILTYLRSVRLQQIEGPAGVLGLRDDLNETVKALSGGQVQGVLIHGLVVE
jgi:flagellar FliL protein